MSLLMRVPQRLPQPRGLSEQEKRHPTPSTGLSAPHETCPPRERHAFVGYTTHVKQPIRCNVEGKYAIFVPQWSLIRELVADHHRPATWFPSRAGRSLTRAIHFALVVLVWSSFSHGAAVSSGFVFEEGETSAKSRRRCETDPLIRDLDSIKSYLNDQGQLAFLQTASTVQLAAVGGTVLALALGDDDEEVSGTISGHRNDLTERIVRFGKALGEVPLNLGALSVLGAYGYATGDPQAVRANEVAVYSAVSSVGIITPAIKYLVGRARPNAGLGSHVFRPFSGDASFPSGHTTLAFSLAGSIHYHYPGWIGRSALLLAATTAYSRVHTQNHWPSDVLAGALVGYGTARLVAASLGTSVSGDPLFVPIATDELVGGCITRRF